MNRPRDRSSARREPSAESPSAGASRTSRKPERRAHPRYCITAELEYRITRRQTVVEKGNGLTIDISSSGVLFESRLPLPIGLKIEVSIAWPAREAISKRLELHAEGHTVRTENNRTAIYIKRYSFREQAEQSTPASS